MMINKHQNSIW